MMMASQIVSWVFKFQFRATDWGRGCGMLGEKEMR